MWPDGHCLIGNVERVGRVHASVAATRARVGQLREGTRVVRYRCLWSDWGNHVLNSLGVWEGRVRQAGLSRVVSAGCAEVAFIGAAWESGSGGGAARQSATRGGDGRVFGPLSHPDPSPYRRSLRYGLYRLVYAVFIHSGLVSLAVQFPLWRPIALDIALLGGVYGFGRAWLTLRRPAAAARLFALEGVGDANYGWLNVHRVDTQLALPWLRAALSLAYALVLLGLVQAFVRVGWTIATPATNPLALLLWLLVAVLSAATTLDAAYYICLWRHRPAGGGQ